MHSSSGECSTNAPSYLAFQAYLLYKSVFQSKKPPFHKSKVLLHPYFLRHWKSWWGWVLPGVLVCHSLVSHRYTLTAFATFSPSQKCHSLEHIETVQKDNLYSKRAWLKNSKDWEYKFLELIKSCFLNIAKAQACNAGNNYYVKVYMISVGPITRCIVLCFWPKVDGREFLPCLASLVLPRGANGLDQWLWCTDAWELCINLNFWMHIWS